MRWPGYSGLLLVAALALLGLLWLFQRRLIYFPLGPDVPPAASVIPGAVDIAFRTEDGLSLAGWFVPAAHGAGRATVLLFAGNAGNRADRAALAAGLARRGFSVLLFDYRGYGGNPGSPDERGLARDARAALGYVTGRPDVRAERIVYFGESLGAAVAVGLAAEREPWILVLRSPFTSLSDAGKFHYPFLPVETFLRDRFSSIAAIGSITAPVVVVAGTVDEIVPFAQSRTLYEAAGARRKRFIAIEGATHNDPALVSGAAMLDQIAGFLADEEVG